MIIKEFAYTITIQRGCMDKKENITDDDTHSEEQESSLILRRTCLKIVGTSLGVVGIGGTASEGVHAETSGYGEGGFGEVPFGGISALAVSTKDAANVASTSAKLSGSLDDLDGASSADCYFEWRQVGANSWTATTKQTLSSTGAFSTDVTGLKDGIDYEYRAVAEASDGDTDRGATVTFTTTDDLPGITSESPTNVTASSATLNGTLDDLGRASSADCYFEWRQVGTSSWTATTKQTLSSPGSFSVEVASLSGSTEYESRAAVQASDGDIDTGNAVSFTTSSSNTAPSIDSYSVTEAGSPNPHCEITADWVVSDADGNLATVTVEVVDASGSLVDSAKTDISGSTASSTDGFKIKQVDGKTFDVALTVTDTDGNTVNATQTVSE